MKSFCKIIVSGLVLGGIAACGPSAELLKLRDTNECVECKLGKTDFTEEKLAGANLRKADLRKTDFSGVDLSGADLSHTDIRKSDLRRANLSGVTMTNALMQHSRYDGADMSNGNFEKSDLRKSVFSEAKLVKANLQNADIRAATLDSADLTEANLSGANLEDASLEKANLTNANLTGAILEDADLPSIVFLNMDVVEGSPNAYAAIAWHRRGSHQGLGSPSDSLPETYERAVRPLRGLAELAEFRKFQGDYLGEGDLLALDGHPLVAFGSHLSNHWHGPSLRDSQFDEAILTNQHRLDRYRNGMRWLAYPFGVGTHNLDERARGHGVRRMFTGQGRLNPDAAQEVLDRIDLSAEIRNQFLFRWRLSSRTVLHGLRG